MFSCQCASNAKTDTHCISYALYDLADPDFESKTDQKHLKTCVNRRELLTALENITEANKKNIFS